MPDVRVDGLALECLRVLTLAQGPLTVADVCKRIGERHRGVVLYGDAYAALRRLAAAERICERADTIGGTRARMFWIKSPTEGAQHGDHR